MFEDNVLERDGLMLEGVESRRSVPASQEPSTAFERPVVTARAPFPDESPAAKAPASPAQAEASNTQATSKGDGAGFPRRRPLLSAIGAVLLASTLAGGYFYLDYARHVESTDDAFIAARQFSIAPKVSGYITAVPVTDNQHVKAGDVIARIDDRDYRTALAQAEAQVAASPASINTYDAQLHLRQA